MGEISSNSNKNEADLLELALRLATYAGDPSAHTTQLLPGQLPSGLPVNIPLPEGSRVLGSLIRTSESISMYLDVHLTPVQGLAFYRQHLHDAGWQITNMHGHHRGGFILPGSRIHGGSETFYLELNASSSTTSAQKHSSTDEDNFHDSGTSLTVDAFLASNNRTDLRLHLQMNAPSPYGPARYRRGRPPRGHIGSLPALEAPEGSNQIGGGSGSGSNIVYADATLETSNTLSMLAAHYKTELEQAECMLTGQGQDGPIAWTTWTLQEDAQQWHGVLVIMQIFAQEYSLTMRMHSSNSGKAQE